MAEPSTAATGSAAVTNDPCSPVPNGNVKKPESFETKNSGSTDSNDLQHEKTMDSKTVLLIRLLFLFHFGSMGAVVPFMSVYYHSIGHGGPIIGLLSAIKPLTTLFVGPLWGILSDRSQNPVFVLQTTLLFSVVGKIIVATQDDATYMAVVVFVTALFFAPIKSLLDSLILSRIPDRSYYGRLRLFGQVGFALGTFLMGSILSARESGVCSKPDSLCHSFSSAIASVLPLPARALAANFSFWIEHYFPGYKLIFFVHGVLGIPAIFFVRALDRMEKKAKSLKQKEGSNKSKGNVSAKKTSMKEGLTLLVAQNPNAIIFFVLVFVAGINAGVNEAFGNLRIRELGGTPQLIGIFRVAGACGGAPMFWFSGAISKRFGGETANRAVLFFLMVYAVRFAGLGIMPDVSYALPGEFLRSAAFAIFMSSVTVYTHKIAPEGMNATLLILVNGLYGGLGISLGAVLSGKLQHDLGTAQTFCYVAMFNLVFIFLIVLYLGFWQPSGSPSRSREKIKTA